MTGLYFLAGFGSQAPPDFEKQVILANIRRNQKITTGLSTFAPAFSANSKFYFPYISIKSSKLAAIVQNGKTAMTVIIF